MKRRNIFTGLAGAGLALLGIKSEAKTNDYEHLRLGSLTNKNQNKYVFQVEDNTGIAAFYKVWECTKTGCLRIDRDGRVEYPGAVILNIIFLDRNNEGLNPVENINNLKEIITRLHRCTLDACVYDENKNRRYFSLVNDVKVTKRDDLL